MVNLRCNDYGFECDYVTEGNIEKIIFDYRNHMNNEHGIDYSPGSILESIKRKIASPLKHIKSHMEC